MSEDKAWTRSFTCDSPVYDVDRPDGFLHPRACGWTVSGAANDEDAYSQIKNHLWTHGVYLTSARFTGHVAHVDSEPLSFAPSGLGGKE